MVLELGLNEGVRRGGRGALGGGANGGGSFVDNGDDAIKFDSALSCTDSSGSSLALGTMSDRNSRSSDERARELRGLDPPDDLVREKRLRKRETAEGGGGEGSRTISACGFDMGAETGSDDTAELAGASDTMGMGGMVGVLERVVIVDLDLLLSMLDLGELLRVVGLLGPG